MPFAREMRPASLAQGEAGVQARWSPRLPDAKKCCNLCTPSPWPARGQGHSDTATVTQRHRDTVTQ